MYSDTSDTPDERDIFSPVVGHFPVSSTKSHLACGNSWVVIDLVDYVRSMVNPIHKRCCALQ
jgi:hypothetical protein